MSEYHPYCAYFPMLAPDKLEELASDIKKNGLLEPIARDDKGRILDGRNRQAACLSAGVPPSYETFRGSDEQKLAFVMSKNVLRRDMSASQRASAAAKVKEEYTKLAKQRQRKNGASRAKNKESNPENLPDSQKGDARDQVGKTFKVCGKLVDMAEKVHKKAIPEIVAAVDAGDLRVSAALDVASLPHDQQQAIMDNGGVPAVREAAAVVRRSRGRIVRPDGTGVPATPPHPPSIPVIPPAAASNAASSDESLAALVVRAKASSHFRRLEAINELVETLPEREILAVLARCESLINERRK
jgi:hypothetical protein